MKRTLFGLAVVAAMVCVFVLAVHSPVSADKTYSVRDLNGTYYFTATQVRIEAGAVVYCSGYGTATFDGAGTARMESTERCSAGPLVHDSAVNNYSVSADGFVQVWDFAIPVDNTHCKIVDNGRMLLCDGTTQRPDALSFFVIAVKQ